MALVEVGSLEIAGVTCIIQAQGSKHGGIWYLKDATDNADLGSGETLDQAKQRARVAIAKRKVKVEVKFRTTAGEHGVATGFHARNRTILVRLDGEADTLDGRGIREGILRADTPQEVIDRFGELEDQKREIYREAKTITDEYGFDLHQAVTAAINEKVAEQGDAGAAA